MRSLLLPVLALASMVAAPLVAQQQVTMVATAHVAEVMHIEVIPTALPWTESNAAGEAEEAVVLRVSANRDWKVMVTGSGGSAPLSVRVGHTRGSVESAARDYQRISAGPTEIARGGAGGGTTLTLDYRWGGRAPGQAAAEVPTYTLVAN